LIAAIVLRIVKIGAVSQSRRVAETVPVDIVPGRQVSVESIVLSFCRGTRQMLPFHSQGGYGVGHNVSPLGFWFWFFCKKIKLFYNITTNF
jgi:hypothetical protein